ncbi:glycoside hydrolase family 30 protein [Capnocytophaga stomatis]|uniref:glycoside hydrolase family 30 protein n=1 Tax=Capnocytophaga stomatis TaxID=1848904 RepID=UPI001AC7219C|nr:glycoside hydrolase family 30 beta sandwich domain-containing protein [Capnocytophaga stomatis]GIM50811.1 glucosylceramidase [Capnocytophaga stomatis]
MTRISLSHIVLGIWAVTSCTAPKSNLPKTDNEKVTVLISTGNREKNFHREEIMLQENKTQISANITLNPSKKHQTVYGFGSAITGSTCYNLLKMNTEDRKSFLKETFSVSEGLGQSYIRVPIGCSDFSLSEYTCCDTPGIENFALQEEDTQYIIPILKEILEINPDIQIIGSPWTPPRWMKVNNLKDLQPYNQWTSGHLNPKYYQDYATYFVKWIQAMKSHGIDVQAITIQNEPLNRGNSASMFMGWEEQLAFIKTALGKTLKDSGLNTKIYLFDHNYNYDNMPKQQGYPTHIYNDEEASKYVTGAAYHNYGGQYSELEKIHHQYPDKELIFTETSIGTWNDGRNLSLRLADDMEQIGFGTLNNWCKAVIVWNLMLDENGAPNREGGCKTCFGAVDISTNDYKTITKNSHYYVIGHLSSVIKPDAVRIENQKNTDQNILCTSFQNTDGSYALVLLNKNAQDTQVVVTDGQKHFSYTVPANAVASFRWK